jgi:hypothetical protein
MCCHTCQCRQPGRRPLGPKVRVPRPFGRFDAGAGVTRPWLALSQCHCVQMDTQAAQDGRGAGADPDGLRHHPGRLRPAGFSLSSERRVHRPPIAGRQLEPSGRPSAYRSGGGRQRGKPIRPADGGTTMARRKAERPAERGVRRAETNTVSAYLTALRAPKVPGTQPRQPREAACADRAVDSRGIVTDTRGGAHPAASRRRRSACPD